MIFDLPDSRRRFKITTIGINENQATGDEMMKAG